MESAESVISMASRVDLKSASPTAAGAALMENRIGAWMTVSSDHHGAFRPGVAVPAGQELLLVDDRQLSRQ
ncbi:hypothetical protein [Kitasatospora sp. NPDC087314]|uniref:hypothetical protein n=1 Tax=Kitasatospora sp. NPDC087314 TaxID=3364068 RepID=UPI003817BE55